MTATEPREGMDRRSAARIVFGSAAALAGGLAALAVGFVANALGRRREEPWILVGPFRELPREGYQRVVVSVERTHAWVEKRVPVTVYVREEDGGARAILSVCSHLGCSVRWNGEEGLFRCPCHQGVFDAEGDVVSGPPPGPLTRLETRVEEETLYVRLPDSRLAL